MLQCVLCCNFVFVGLLPFLWARQGVVRQYTRRCVDFEQLHVALFFDNSLAQVRLVFGVRMPMAVCVSIANYSCASLLHPGADMNLKSDLSYSRTMWVFVSRSSLPRVELFGCSRFLLL